MTTTTDPIVAQIAAADSRRRLSFRVTFVLTWIVLIGVFVVWLLTLPENPVTGRKPFDPASTGAGRVAVSGPVGRRAPDSIAPTDAMPGRRAAEQLDDERDAPGWLDRVQ